MEPPEDTRAYFRGRCISRYPDAIAAASWDSLIMDTGPDALQRIPCASRSAAPASTSRTSCARPRTPPRWWPRLRVQSRCPARTARRIGTPRDEESDDAAGAGAEAIQKKGGGGDDDADATPARRTTSSKAAELKEEMDDILDEIDSVLEENAEEFVKSYVQKGGE